MISKILMLAFFAIIFLFSFISSSLLFSLVSAQAAVPNTTQNATRDDALNAITQSEHDMEEMINAGFSVNLINDTITSAKQALQRADFAEMLRSNATGPIADAARNALEGLNYSGFTYSDVLVHTQEVSARKVRAYNISDSLTALGFKISNYKKLLNTTDAETIFANAKTSFYYERYDEAESYIAQANDLLDTKKSEIATFNILLKSGQNFIQQHWLETLVISFAAVICGFFVWREYQIKRIEKRLKKLKAEKESLVSLMKKAQRERFEKGKISNMIYNIRMSKYSTKLNQIKETIPVLESQLRKDKKIKPKIRARSKKS